MSEELCQQVMNCVGVDLIWNQDEGETICEYTLADGSRRWVLKRLDGKTVIADNLEVFDMVKIETALKAVANKELSKEIIEELNQEDPINPEQTIASAKKEKEDENKETEKSV